MSAQATAPVPAPGQWAPDVEVEGVTIHAGVRV